MNQWWGKSRHNRQNGMNVTHYYIRQACVLAASLVSHKHYNTIQSYRHLFLTRGISYWKVTLVHHTLQCPGRHSALMQSARRDTKRGTLHSTTGTYASRNCALKILELLVRALLLKQSSSTSHLPCTHSLRPELESPIHEEARSNISSRISIHIFIHRNNTWSNTQVHIHLHNIRTWPCYQRHMYKAILLLSFGKNTAGVHSWREERKECRHNHTL